MHFCFICQEDFSESLSYAAKQQVFYCCVNSNSLSEKVNSARKLKFHTED